MTESQWQQARAMLARQRAGWQYLESERLLALRKIVTKEVLPSLQSSFEYAQTLPPRSESGFVEFYAALARGKSKCSI